MDNSRSPWAVLGLDEGASLGEVRRAYRFSAKRTHPDAGGSAAAFDELHTAFDAVRLLAPRDPERLTVGPLPSGANRLSDRYAAVKPAAPWHEQTRPVTPAARMAAASSARGTNFAAILLNEMVRLGVAA